MKHKTYHKHTAADKDLWVRMYLDGKTVTEICAELGVRQGTVKKCLKDRGVRVAGPGGGRRKRLIGMNKEEVQKCGFLRAKYGITLKQYNEMVAAQGGVCAICKNPPGGRGKNDYVLHVDHNHKTGAIRDLLCSRCNLAIGQMSEDPLLLEAAAQYLRKKAA